MLFSLLLTSLLTLACFIDLKEFRIPNMIPLALIALFLIRMAASGEIVVLSDHMLAFALTLALGMLAFAFKLVGGGDAKLLAALALWFGMVPLPSLITITALGGGVLALILLVLRHLATRLPVLASSMASSGGGTGRPRLLDRHAPVPYALPIAAAALWLEWF